MSCQAFSTKDCLHSGRLPHLPGCHLHVFRFWMCLMPCWLLPLHRGGCSVLLLRRIRVNLETKEKAHKPGSAPVCPNDAWVCFRNSELVAGRLGKATLGGGNKAGLFQVSCRCC